MKFSSTYTCDFFFNFRSLYLKYIIIRWFNKRAFSPSLSRNGCPFTHLTAVRQGLEGRSLRHFHSIIAARSSLPSFLIAMYKSFVPDEPICISTHKHTGIRVLRVSSSAQIKQRDELTSPVFFFFNFILSSLPTNRAFTLAWDARRARTVPSGSTTGGNRCT